MDENEEVLNVYRSGIVEIINTDLSRGCIGYNAALDKRYNDYLSGEQKLDSYVRLLDSLLDVRRSLQPKCMIAYSNRKLHIWGDDVDQKATIDDLKESIKDIISNRGVDGDFGDATVLIDKLTTPSSADPKVLSTEYVDIVWHETGERRVLPDNVIGIMSFSQIAFDRNLHHALLYFEYYCGQQCWRGKLVYLSRKGETWAVDKMESVFDT